MTDAIALDDSQRAAVEVEADARQVVVAGPGSGKTEVVSALVDRLIEEEGVDPDDGILVVSFSNAAVHAADARRRLHGAEPVTIRTLDSLATRIVRDHADDGGEGLDFDARVSLATRLLRDGEADEVLEDVEHLVVDEVQDVVGVRADFLLAMLEHLPGDAGFSLLGDPAQGIYDFQIRPDPSGRRPRSRTTSADLLRGVREMRGVEERVLTGQYRATSRDARAAAALRSRVLEAGGSEEVADFEAEIVPVGDIVEAVVMADRWPGTTAFLTADNGQAMLVAREVADHGHRVELRRGAQQRVLAGWVARALGAAPTASVNRDEFLSRAADVLPDVDAAVLWRATRGVVGGRGTEIDVKALARRLMMPGSLVRDLIDEPMADIVVSTVHRAKGLEFDNVVLVDFPDKPWRSDDVEPDEAGRTRFVAVTRARDLIARATGPDDRWLSRHPRTRRWYRRGRQQWQTFGFEIRVDDVDTVEPGGLDPAEAQNRLATVVRPGDRLELALDLDRSSLTLPVYTLLHDGVAVARTSAAFGHDLVARIRTIEKGRHGWPRLSGARVESVATVVGNPQPGPVGVHGLWLAPVTAGLLDLDWKGDQRA
ncbi:AAA family ATPase [Isoptericola sp. b515]|uniref:UvrD-helicase domain-containing protein n=1 Tax=Isoptericola sp. b515 TaxID=3064652 RepID=UPI002712E250|nr:UvrD-helicase domain-containing protein [Isoptericola sp. b515]MDO8147494.1 AAA family ATPase [Isoptericola sp. b515]